MKEKDKEREIWVGESRYNLGEDNIIYICTIGEYDEKMAQMAYEASLKLINMVEGPSSALIDLNKCGKQSAEARKIWKKLTEIEKTNKVAFFGLHPVARVISSFVMGVSKNNDLRFFKTREEALAWLKK